MVQVSKRKLPDKILTKLFLILFEVVGRKDKEVEFKQVLSDLLTETEQIMIIKRLAILYLLLKKIDNTIICDVLKVSGSTVSKYSILIGKEEGLVSYLKKLVEKDKFREFIEDTFQELFYQPGRYGVNWKNAWEAKFGRENRKLTGL